MIFLSLKFMLLVLILIFYNEKKLKKIIVIKAYMQSLYILLCYFYGNYYVHLFQQKSFDML